MKIFIPSVLTGADCKCFTEIFSIIPFIGNIDTYRQVTNDAGFWNEGLYTKLFFNPPIHITRTSEIAHANIVVIPFKYDPNDLRVQTICDEARSYKKKVVAFYNDDNAGQFDMPDNLHLFRTSAERSKLGPKERILPVLVPDHKPGSLILGDYNVNNLDIGFCGHIEGIRHGIVDKLSRIHPSFKPIIRQGFWAPNICKIQARRDYYSDMSKSSYTLCMRGGGNFSYRFYEALSFGRIPILIDTDMALPNEKLIKWDDYIVRIPFDEFMQMDSKSLTDRMFNKQYSPKKNRQLWEKYFSPEGYLDYLLYHEIHEINNLLHTES